MRDDELNAAAAEVFRHFERRPYTGGRMRQLQEWALSIVCSDGLLPIGVIAIPAFVTFVFPRAEVLHVAANVIVPVVAFFVRLVIGRKHFRERSLHTLQFLLFVLSIFYLILLEAMLILFHEFGNQAQVKANDWIILGKLFLIYLAAMSISLFPFQILRQSEQANQTAAPRLWDT